MIRNLKKYFGDMEFYRRLCAIAIPIALQSLITVGVNMTDTMMMGTLGEIGLSATALANQFIGIYQICCMGLGMGASVMVARFWGMKDILSLKKTITITLRFCIILALIFTCVTIIMPETLVRIYTPDQDIIREGTRYYRWSIPTYLLMGLSLVCTIILRSVGKSNIPLICSIATFISNIFFNWIFIFGHLGAPRMEVAGAALGTVIARVLEFVTILSYFLFIDKTIRYKLKDLLMDCRGLVKEYINISLPVLISDALLALGMSAIAMIMGRIGSSFVSANSITTVTQRLTTVLTQGICQAGCIITGHTLGAGKREQAQREGYYLLYFGIFIGVVAGLVILIISKPVVECYNITEETKKIAYQLMNAVAFIVVFQSSNTILTKGVLRGGGDTKFLMLADIIFLWVASIPLGILAGFVFHLSAFWIYFFMKIDQIIKCIWCVFRLRSGKWIKIFGTSKEE